MATQTQFAARVAITPKLPVLAIEDLDPHLSALKCTEKSIEVHFHFSEALQTAKRLWVELGTFVIVTAHEGCNEDGGRSPYR